MKVRKLYVVGDKKRLVMQALVRDLEKAGIVVQVVAPEMTRLLPEDANNVIFTLSSASDMMELRSLEGRTDLKLYIIGTLGTLSMQDEQLIKQLATVHFPSFSVSIKDVLEAIEKHCDARKHILVVDDEPMMLRSIKAWLCEEYEITLVNSGRNALTYLEKHTVDLILLDYEMPLMSGSELLGHLRADSRLRQFPVIFLTAKDDKDSVMNVMSLKPDGYLLKSRPSNEITATVHEFFDKRSKRTLHEEKPNA